ncbi:MAG: FAD-binding protein, partial [Clostridia bacterium]|nr:FAD-binding protein [Clostridia bacterium]
MEYLWTKHVQLPSFPALARDCSTDVLIIGGGMAGILCALLLQQAGVNCLLAEGQTIGGGIT